MSDSPLIHFCSAITRGDGAHYPDTSQPSSQLQNYSRFPTSFRLFLSDVVKHFEFHPSDNLKVVCIEYS
jgi:hypothetical protein